MVDKVNDFVKELDSAMMSCVKQSPKSAVMKTEPQGRMNLNGENLTQFKDFHTTNSIASKGQDIHSVVH